MNLCDSCLRRPRYVGGNESCTLYHRQEFTVFHKGSLKSRVERETVEAAWLRFPGRSECGMFRPGDRRAPKGPELTSSLFGGG